MSLQVIVLGEYAALVAAEAIEFTDAIRLVAERGRLMQNAVADGEGAMAAIIGLADSDIVRICNDIASSTGKVVSAVNFNSPGKSSLQEIPVPLKMRLRL